MYPNLFYAFKDWFGVEWQWLNIFHTFGLMVAVSFIISAVVLSSELKRKEKLALLLPREETIIVGKPASIIDLLINFLIGFLFAYKFVGLINKPADVNAQDYIFSSQGNFLAGILLGVFLAGLKWREKNKQKSKTPEQRSIRIWPHDRVGDIVVIALIFGILGAKLFDGLENWDSFVADPVGRLLSPGGLTFYGGLIVAAIAVCIYASKKNIKLIHLVDAAAPVLLLAYAVGRIGCQVAGDGDWGIYNSAYITGADGKAVEAKPGEYKAQLEKYSTYFLKGDNKGKTLDEISNKAVKAPSFLPTWMVAYSYPQNVNDDGITMPGIKDEHNAMLPVPVFPTPFYETVTCTILFFILWGIRRRIKIAGLMTGIYLVLNGTERFLIEHIRVNNLILGMKITQAELISFSMILAGVIISAFVLLRKKSEE